LCSPDSVFGRPGDAANQVVTAVAGLRTATPVILIDGPAGAGKSSLADALLARWPGPRAPALVRMDDIYPGWDGLACGSTLLHEELLAPLRSHAPAGWHRYDWGTQARAERHPIDAAHPLIVEGCGTLTADNAPLAELRVWLEADDVVRKRRALERDHGGFDPFWERWEAQFAAYVLRENPMDRADLILNGTP
jgi:uridine kinase